MPNVDLPPPTSAGVAFFSEHATTSPLLLQVADLAPRRAVESGSDRVSIATKPMAGITQSLAMGQ
jgi:hypothetical protein